MTTEMSPAQAAYEHIVDTLRADPEPLILWAAENIAYLGSKAEWSMDDNFCTTEGLAALPEKYGLLAAHDQDVTELTFYGLAAKHLGYDVDLEDDEDEDEED